MEINLDAVRIVSLIQDTPVQEVLVNLLPVERFAETVLDLPPNHVIMETSQVVAQIASQIQAIHAQEKLAKHLPAQQHAVME